LGKIAGQIFPSVRRKKMIVKMQTEKFAAGSLAVCVALRSGWLREGGAFWVLKVMPRRHGLCAVFDAELGRTSSALLVESQLWLAVRLSVCGWSGHVKMAPPLRPNDGEEWLPDSWGQP